MGVPGQFSPPSYWKFHAFVSCSSAHATHRVNADFPAVRVSSKKPCYSKQDSELLLCDDCLDFWRECRQNQDHTSWEMARFLRDLRIDQR
jgi:hypothetical protein